MKVVSVSLLVVLCVQLACCGPSKGPCKVAAELAKAKHEEEFKNLPEPEDLEDIPVCDKSGWYAQLHCGVNLCCCYNKFTGKKQFCKPIEDRSIHCDQP